MADPVTPRQNSHRALGAPSNTADISTATSQDTQSGYGHPDVKTREPHPTLLRQEPTDARSANVQVATQPVLQDSGQQTVKTPVQLLFNGIGKGDSSAVREAIRLGADVNNVRDGFVMLPLTAAVHFGNQEIIAMLIAAGAEVSKPDNATQTALEIAAKHNNYAILGPICEKTGKLDFENLHIRSLLKEAVRFADIALLGRIVNAGATKHMTPLERNECAARLILCATLGTDEQIGMLTRLLQEGANANGVHGLFDTPHLISAAGAKNDDVINLLLKHGANVNLQDNRGNTALMMAVNNLWTFNAVMKAKPDINLVNREGESAILLAASNGMAESTSFLLLAGARTDQKDQNHCGLLIAAVKSGNMKVVEKVLDAKLKVDQRDKNKETALFYAVKSKSFEMIELLVKHGANINIRNWKNDTPLISACISQAPKKIVQKMLDLGANPKLKGLKNRTALDVTRQNKNKELSDLLENKPAQTGM